MHRILVSVFVSALQRDGCAMPISVTRVSIDPFFVSNGLGIARNAQIDTFNQLQCRDVTASETD